MSLAQRGAAELLKAPDHVLRQLKWDFSLWGMPHQFVPSGATNKIIWWGGRGAAKTRAAAEAIRADIYRGVRYLALVNRTIDGVRVMIEGKAGLQDVFPPHERPHYSVGKKKVIFHTGAEAYCLSVEAGEDEWRGKGFEVAWLDELSTYGDALEGIWRQTILSARIGQPRFYGTTNTQPTNSFLKKLIREAPERGITAIPCSSYDNWNNLPKETQDEIDALAKTKLGRCEVFPEFFEIEGALWQDDWIRIQPAPAKGLTIVSIDPAGTGKPWADEHGIIAIRRSVRDGRPVAHVLEDASFHGPVNEWPKKAVELAKKHRATVMVIERNRGLDYLREMIRHHNASIRIEEVSSDISKGDRAFPVAQKYEVGRVFHDHHFERLEEQMTTWVPESVDEHKRKKKQRSPDRVDALCHGIRFLNLDVGIATFAPRNVPFPSMFSDDD